MHADPGRTPLPAALPGTAEPAREVLQRLPVDAGLAALGLVALAGAGIGAVAAIAFFVAGRTFGVGGAGTGGMLPALGIFSASLVRTAYHIGVARAATRRLPIVGEAATRYLVVAAIHTAIILGIVAFVWRDGPIGPAVPTLVGLVGLLMGWPVTLWLLVRRRAIRAIFQTADTFDVGLVPGDRSVASAGVLMTVFGALFLVIDLGVAAVLVASGMPLGLTSALWYTTLVAFAVRSSLHLGWGVAAMRGRMDHLRFRRLSGVYLWLAFGTAVLALGAMFSVEEVRNAFRHAPINIIYVAVTVMAALLAWPAALKAFAQDTVPFWDEARDAERPFRPAVDRGLTALGYFHVWLAVWSLAQWLAAVLGMSALGQGVSQGGGPLVVLLALAAVGLELWVGLELVAMTPRYRLAALAYAAGAVLVVVVEQVALGAATAEEVDAGPSLSRLASLIGVLAGLVLPVVTIVLAWVRPRAPER